MLKETIIFILVLYFFIGTFFGAAIYSLTKENIDLKHRIEKLERQARGSEAYHFEKDGVAWVWAQVDPANLVE